MPPRAWISTTGAVATVRSMFQPGSVWRGTITIPGDNLEGEAINQYLLEVVEERDGLLYAIHSAYNDHQVVTLTFERKGEVVWVHYYDMETFCSGPIDRTIGILTGTVKQLVNGDEGFFHPPDEALHIFDLRCVPTTADHRRQSAWLWREKTRLVGLVGRLLALKTAAADTLARHFATLEPDEALTRRLETLAQQAVQKEDPTGYAAFLTAVDFTEQRLDWANAILHAGLLAEQYCCELRAVQNRLQSLQFETEEEKGRLLSTFPTREHVHQTVDDAFKAVHNLVWQRPKRANYPDDGIMFYKASLRLPGAYKRFDAALRQAEQRLPRTVVIAHCRPLPPPRNPSEGALCSICQITVDPADEGLELDCHHAFHRDCLFQWLRGQSSCPNCRADIAPPGPSGSLAP
eukprot:TRINITY_DN5469_c0_g1_i1.p1 TRINITY_DN5469_c0_g1~~TRINITY_DN5469_c0_g1_i1.p1  ORF type:complete len:405 (-),score=89.24 TRINITY_DN5469_c0_g1_i1:320-1534(-)